MPAPATKHLLTLAPLLMLLMLLSTACASNPDPGVAATPSGAVAQEAQTLDRYAPPPPVSASPVEELADLEHSLAAYEAELAQHEARLQAMGVRIARADPAAIRADADDEADANRFAQPPPARPGDAARSSPPTAGATGGTARPPAPTAPRPTTRPSPEPSPSKSKDRKQAKKEAEGEAPATKAPSANDPTARSARDLGKSAGSAPARDEAREKDGEHGRCADLCDVAHATCDLEAKICDLATRHTDEPRYAEVCQRAGDDCRAAAEACTLCSP